MKIIIEIKESAKLERIAEFGDCLKQLKDPEPDIEGFPDVIADIHKEG